MPQSWESSGESEGETAGAGRGKRRRPRAPEQLPEARNGLAGRGGEAGGRPRSSVWTPKTPRAGEIKSENDLEPRVWSECGTAGM